MTPTSVRIPELEGGDLLREYVDHYLGDPNSQNLSVLLMALHDSWVFAPEDAQEKRVFHREGGAYYPLFSSPSQCPLDKGQSALREAAFVDCAEEALNAEEIDGIVLDPYSKYLILPDGFVRAALDIDSKNAPYQP